MKQRNILFIIFGLLANPTLAYEQYNFDVGGAREASCTCPTGANIQCRAVGPNARAEQHCDANPRWVLCDVIGDDRPAWVSRCSEPEKNEAAEYYGAEEQR